ncbi:hypothetical protein FRC07_002461, partial [Ceratobasidium sp. 392]
MPLNAWRTVEKVVGALGLMDVLDEVVPLTASGAEVWRAYAKHEAEVLRSGTMSKLTVRDILRKGALAPLTKSMVLAVHNLLRASSIAHILASTEWPVQGSLGDLLMAAINDISEDAWDKAFDRQNLDWLPALVQLEVPRTYSISEFSLEGLPDYVDLTVSRTEHNVCTQLVAAGADRIIPGVASGFLNPNPLDDYIPHGFLSQNSEVDEALVGIARPLNFQLPISTATPIAMFAGGSGIAPFRSFWQARIASGAIGRNVLFLGVQSRKKFLYKQELREHVLAGDLELHVAFSRDSNGLVYDPQLRDLVEKQMEPRYIDSTIVDQGNYVCDLVTSTKMGGLGGSLYICGSLSLYETVMSGLRKALYKYRAVTKESADALLATAFAERRFMLDVFMTPRVTSEQEPTIPLSVLAKHTGHRDGKMWIGVHGSVYDVTDFLPIHPGGTLIVAASAGLDASVTFDEVAHTSNPEVMSLLGKYFIGRLPPTPEFRSRDLSELRAGWIGYLRTCVEGLTTMSFETQSILKDSRIWFQEGLINIGGVRKFYQAAIELDFQLLEHVRDEISAGLDAFDRVAEVIKGYPGKEKQALYKIASVLMRYLERVAERLESYYTDHAALNLYNAAKEANPARARWNLLRRRVSDGSFFVLTRQIRFTDDLDDIGMSRSGQETRAIRRKRETVTFDQILSEAVSSVAKTERREQMQMRDPKPIGQTGRLAAAHTQRAEEPTNASSSYEQQSVIRANKRMSTFIQSRLKDIRRLSRSASNLDLEHALATYGVNSSSKLRSQFTDTDSDSGASMHTGDGQQHQPRGPAERMKLAPRFGSGTSSPARRIIPLPEPRPTAPLRVPPRSNTSSSDTSADVSIRGLRSVRPGSIAESQQKYRRSP